MSRLLGTVVLEITRILLGRQVILISYAFHVIIVRSADGSCGAFLVLTPMLLRQFQFQTCLLVVAGRRVYPDAIMANFAFNLVC